MQRTRVLLFAATAITIATVALTAGASPAPDSPAATAQTANAQTAAEAPVFEVDPLWPKPMPNHWILGSAVGIAVDARDHVFVLHRTDSFNRRTEIGAATDPPTGTCCLPAPAVLEFDPAGTLVSHWGGPGDGYVWPTSNHGLAIDPQGNVWIGGSGGTDAHLLKFTREGRFIAQIGRVGVAPAAGRGRAGTDTAYAGVSGRAGGRGQAAAEPPSLPPNSAATDAFGGPADLSFGNGVAFVADGFRNRRVAVVDIATGAVRSSWGAYGGKPDDAPLAAYDPAKPAARLFGTPVRCAERSRDGMVYVCDATNDRIQVFRDDGTFVKEKTVAPATRAAGSVWDIAFSADPQQRFLYVADGSSMKIHVLDRASLDVLTSFGDGGRQPGQFYAVTAIATDSNGNLYTVETNQGKRVQKFNFKGIAPVTSPDGGVLWPKKGGAE
jgi:DNA-binding beta-propeller fold protein YncE